MSKFTGGEFVYVPTVVAPITVSYNLSGVEDLQLSPATIAKIFQAEITTWDDPAIAADNPDADLPDNGDHRRPPRRRLGHHRQLLQVPRGVRRAGGHGRGRRLEARHGFGAGVAGEHARR